MRIWGCNGCSGPIYACVGIAYAVGSTCEVAGHDPRCQPEPSRSMTNITLIHISKTQSVSVYYYYTELKRNQFCTTKADAEQNGSNEREIWLCSTSCSGTKLHDHKYSYICVMWESVCDRGWAKKWFTMILAQFHSMLKSLIQFPYSFPHFFMFFFLPSTVHMCEEHSRLQAPICFVFSF